MTTATLPRAFGSPAPRRPIRVLVVEDGDPLRDLLGRALRLEGWETCEVADGAAALDAVDDFAPDAIVLDVMLPDFTGTRVVEVLRAAGNTTPVLFLTARDSTTDRVEAYMAGGDDYMTKPFSIDGVVTHLLSLIRQHGVPGASKKCGDLVIDDQSRGVWRSGDPIDLSVVEFRLLDRLMASPGVPVERAELEACILAPDAQPLDDVMATLSKKVDNDREPLIAVTPDAGYAIGATTPSM